MSAVRRDARTGRSLIASLLGLILVATLIPLHAWAFQCEEQCVPLPEPPPAPDPTCSSSNLPGGPTVVLSGLVTNARALPIVDACVYWSSGANYGTALTGAGGNYAIVSPANTPITLVAVHRLYEWRQLTVTNPVVASATPQNFKLAYYLTFAVSPQKFNNSPQKTMQLYAYTTAPVAGTRVRFYPPFGSQVSLTNDVLYSDPTGWSRWTGSWPVPVGTADDTYSFTFCALATEHTGDCTTGAPTVLSQIRKSSFIVDSVAPALEFVAPQNGGNTIFASQPIVIRSQDLLPDGVHVGGSDINPTSISLTVQDVAHQESVRTPSVTVGTSTVLSGSILRSTPVQLTAGVQYDATVSAADYAGNVATQTARFLVMASATTTPPAQISVSISSLPPSEVQPGAGADDLYVWKDVTPFLGAFSIYLSDTLHAGDWGVRIGVPINAADVTYTVGGLPATPRHPVESSAKIGVPYSFTQQTGAVQVQIPAQAAEIGADITALVPKTADTGSVRLSLSAQATSTDYLTCVDPTVPPPPPPSGTSDNTGTICVPDPTGYIGGVPMEALNLVPIPPPPPRVGGCPESYADAFCVNNPPPPDCKGCQAVESFGGTVYVNRERMRVTKKYNDASEVISSQDLHGSLSTHTNSFPDAIESGAIWSDSANQSNVQDSEVLASGFFTRWVDYWYMGGAHHWQDDGAGWGVGDNGGFDLCWHKAQGYNWGCVGVR